MKTSMSEHPKRVLVIDDDHDFRKILQKFLESDGWTTDSAPSAERALELYERNHYDLLTLDRCMPGMDGQAFHSKLARTFGHGKRFQRNLPPLLPPILIITGWDDDKEFKELLFAERVIGVLTKPVDWEQLLQTAEESMQWEAHRRGLRRRELIEISRSLKRTALETAHACF